MSKDESTEPPIHLEMIRPVIQLPPFPTHDRDNTQTEKDVQATLLDSTQQKERFLEKQAEPDIQLETMQRYLLRDVPAQGQNFVLRIIQPHEALVRRNRSYSTEHVLFSLSYSTGDTELSPLEITPGLQQIVLTLDADGIPTNYSIDNAQG